MKHGPEWLNEFYGGLRAFNDAHWPMTCTSCGCKFENNDDYVAKTSGASDSTGLGPVATISGTQLVGLLRHCICGNPLLGVFKDRRDNTPEGQKAREQFDHLLDMLLDDGLDPDFARSELLKLVRGKPNKIMKIL